MGRPVPPHGSGVVWTDPDETPGRALYRAAANAEARRQIAMSRRVLLTGGANTLSGGGK